MDSEKLDITNIFEDTNIIKECDRCYLKMTANFNVIVNNSRKKGAVILLLLCDNCLRSQFQK